MRMHAACSCYQLRDFDAGRSVITLAGSIDMGAHHHDQEANRLEPAGNPRIAKCGRVSHDYSTSAQIPIFLGPFDRGTTQR